MANLGGRPPLFTSADDFEALASAYFDRCEDAEKVPTVNGLARALGMHRDTLVEYGKKDLFADVVKHARTRLEEAWEEKLGGPNATGTIFWLKNHGWTDKTESEIYGKDGKELVPTRIEIVAIEANSG